MIGTDSAIWKLTLAYGAWLLASIAIALILALFVGSIVSLLGVDARTTGHRRIVEIAGTAVFVVLAVTPFIVGRRASRSDTEIRS